MSRIASSLVYPSILCAVLLLATATASSADVMGFSCISGNSSADCAILEAQIQVEITEGTTNTVHFRFTNTGPANSSITDVYFDDLAPPVLGNPSLITYSSGVSFSAGCSPANLPSGQDYSFSSSYCADSNNPTQPMGVNPGEWLNIEYTLQSGAGFDDVIAAVETGDYRIGVRVQGFDDDGSEAGINRIPEPTSLLLVTTGLFLVPVFRRRFHRP